MSLERKLPCGRAAGGLKRKIPHDVAAFGERPGDARTRRSFLAERRLFRCGGQRSRVLSCRIAARFLCLPAGGSENFGRSEFIRGERQAEGKIGLTRVGRSLERHGGGALRHCFETELPGNFSDKRRFELSLRRIKPEAGEPPPGRGIRTGLQREIDGPGAVEIRASRKREIRSRRFQLEALNLNMRRLHGSLRVNRADLEGREARKFLRPGDALEANAARLKRAQFRIKGEPDDRKRFDEGVGKNSLHALEIGLMRRRLRGRGRCRDRCRSRRFPCGLSRFRSARRRREI